MENALLPVADQLHAYQDRMTGEKSGLRTLKQFASGWNEETHTKLLSDQQTNVDRMISNDFQLSTSLNKTAVNLGIIQDLLKETKGRLKEYFSRSDVSKVTLMMIYGNLMAVYGRVLMTHNKVNDANELQMRMEYQLQRAGNYT